MPTLQTVLFKQASDAIMDDVIPLYWLLNGGASSIKRRRQNRLAYQYVVPISVLTD